MNGFLKSIVLFLFLIQILTFADDQHNNIQFNFSNTKLSSAFEYLQGKYNVTITYNQEIIGDIVVNSICKECNLQEALNRLLKNTPFLWKKTDSLIVITPRSNENGSISGFIYDNTNKEALIGCNVYFAEIKIGVTSNLNGYYVIPQIPPGSYTFICNSMGYKEYNQKIGIGPGENKILNITLDPVILQGEVIHVVADSGSSINRLYQKPISNINLTAKHIQMLPQLVETDLFRSIRGI